MPDGSSSAAPRKGLPSHTKIIIFAVAALFVIIGATAVFDWWGRVSAGGASQTLSESEIAEMLMLEFEDGLDEAVQEFVKTVEGARDAASRNLAIIKEPMTDKLIEQAYYLDGYLRRGNPNVRVGRDLIAAARDAAKPLAEKVIQQLNNEISDAQVVLEEQLGIKLGETKVQLFFFNKHVEAKSEKIQKQWMRDHGWKVLDDVIVWIPGLGDIYDLLKIRFDARLETFVNAPCRSLADVAMGDMQKQLKDSVQVLLDKGPLEARCRAAFDPKKLAREIAPTLAGGDDL